jgi:RNA polymerase sigma-70 factor (TIGR02960 family)
MTVDEAGFAGLTDPFRRELTAHCYRMLGSVHDAEDLVQETYLRAWRSFDRFEGRSSVRLWLYKIATRVCLTALDGRSRRPLPSGLTTPSDDPRQTVAAAEPAVAWLQPAPDSLIAGASSDPATIVARRAGVRLAFVAALQHLPPRQRAVLILRDVLAWRAAEAAEMLGTTTVAVNSALRRARAQLELAGPVEDDLAEPSDSARKALLDSYVEAFERADMAGLVSLLRADVELEMPPIPTWFTGREVVAGFLTSTVFHSAGAWRLFPTSANGQPAAVVYERAGDGYEPHGVHVLTLIADRVARITAFNDPLLVPTFTRGREWLAVSETRHWNTQAELT